MVAYAAANGVELRIDGTETQVRRPRAHRPGRRAFISGKRKQNTESFGETYLAVAGLVSDRAARR